MAIRTFLVVAVLGFSAQLQAAEFVEIFEMKLLGTCTPADMQQAAADTSDMFRELGYSAEILVTQHGIPQDHLLWIGRSPSAELWGKAHDIWRESADAAAISERINACTEPVGSSTHVPAG